MCTAALQDRLPDFMTNLDGTSVSFPDDKPKNGTDVPLGDATSVDEIGIRQRRERIKQAAENPGSHKPNPIRTRKDILNELT